MSNDIATAKMAPTWVVQSNLTNSVTMELLRRACLHLGLAVHPVSIVARQPTLPLDLPTAPLIAHGATTLVQLASTDRRFQHGVFYNPENFCHSAYKARFGPDYLNADAKLATWEEALSLLSAKGNLFIKPPDDLKSFTGFVATESSLQTLHQRLSTRPEILPLQVVVGQSYEVDAEWRLFVVGTQIISGSMYRPVGDSHIPAGLLDFANQAIQNWRPAPVFVLDVGRIDSIWRIIECNCFNWSRLYNSDVKAIVKAVSEYQVQALGKVPE